MPIFPSLMHLAVAVEASSQIRSQLSKSDSPVVVMVKKHFPSATRSIRQRRARPKVMTAAAHLMQWFWVFSRLEDCQTLQIPGPWQKHPSCPEALGMSFQDSRSVDPHSIAQAEDGTSRRLLQGVDLGLRPISLHVATIQSLAAY